MLVDIILAMELVFISFYLQFISKDWSYLMYGSIGLTALCLIVSIFFVVESPRFLMEKGKKQAEASFTTHAKYNGMLGRFYHYTQTHKIKFSSIKWSNVEG